jgi:uncharacterized protein YndB with AHSA1/START domain
VKARSGAAVFAAAVLAALCCRAESGAEVTVRKVAGREYSVEGEFRAAVAPERAWKVLTDYPGIPRFVSSMKASRVIDRSGGKVLVEQRGSGGFLFFRRRFMVILDVRETPPHTIAFEDMSHDDFEMYAGRWTIETSTSGVLVHYSLRARPRGAAPFAGRAMRRGAEELLEQVRAEMLLEKTASGKDAGGTPR